MPTPKRGARLGSNPAHQRLMMSNLASDLFVHGRIRTTEAKAKHLRPYAEKLITKAKRGDLHARRQVLSDLRDRDVVAYLFEEVAPRFSERNGGYTRILKLGPRKGDNAKMALIELVDRGLVGEGEEFVDESRAQRARGLFGRLRGRRRDEGATDQWTVEDGDEVEDEVDADDAGELVDQVDLDARELAEEVDAADVSEVDQDTQETTPHAPTAEDPTEDHGDVADAGEDAGEDSGEESGEESGKDAGQS